MIRIVTNLIEFAKGLSLIISYTFGRQSTYIDLVDNLYANF